ncbi:MAG: bifunctional pyr operon transcriptional regulator/uracil phosphoribosyltransferase [Methylococcaceae bacterium TMED69]|nr:MAG: bifunctional pyr operon transcriptional regulator/uracil phosphoribosyltransferase [Methylococcaceae bacterium TMED69]|tara:strand:+ start:2131 stop:2643 length:513 start_codon:yes stop_codon:yes gene_type:complete
MKITDLNVDELITTMGYELIDKQNSNKRKRAKVIGIKTGGVWIADKICKMLDISEGPGQLNIAYYRDDFDKIGLHPKVEPSKLNFEIENQHIILVDDVIFTGRTIRAAMNEIFDFGRPQSITLMCLIDREKRELPINPDILGLKVFIPNKKDIKLTGPSPLKLELFDTKR